MGKGKFRVGLPKIKMDKGIPRFFTSEKHETKIRWAVRGFTLFGVMASVVSFPWYISLAISIAFVAIDFFVENILFYYTSAFVLPLPDFEYQSEKWLATTIVSIGEPEDLDSLKMVGLTFDDEVYAKLFFDLLRAWARGAENKNGDLKLTFVIDEDTYFVYLYPNPDSDVVTEQFDKIRKKNALNKYGKEHLGLVMQMTICKGFEAKGRFALGMFIDNVKEDGFFLLAPFIWDGKEPQPLTQIEPIEMHGYKCRLPCELTDDDFEKWHWELLVSRDRVAVG